MPRKFMKDNISLSEALFRRLTRDVKRAVKNPHPDAVHDLRISFRRCQAWRELHKNWIQKADSKLLRDNLDTGLKLAGAVRDLDVVEKLLHRFGSHKFDEKIKAARVEMQSNLLEFLQEHKEFVCASLSSRYSSPSVSEIRLRQYIRLGDRVAKKSSSARELHRFRIAAKKVRYMLELIKSDLPAEWRKKIEDVQQLLGSVNDCRVARRILKQFGNDEEVKKKLKARERRRIREFRLHWPELRFNPGFK